jgi:uncharacterized protein
MAESWHPIQFFIVKVHSLCNIDCSYCYEYNLGNTGWQSKPKKMELSTFEQLCRRIADHRTGAEPFISFHGGEPLQRSPEFFRDAMRMARAILPDVGFGMQTNGILLNEKFIDVFREFGLRAGVSLDGPKLINDRRRVDHRGRGTFDRVMRGIELMQRNRDVWGGILGVVDVEAVPEELIDFYASLDPPSLDLLEPDGNWERLPPGKSEPAATEYGEWLIKAYQHWYENQPQLTIRRFEEILEHCLGGAGSVEYFGVEPAGLVTVATDGAFEAVDQIKSAYDGAEFTGLDIFKNSLDDVVSHPLTQQRLLGTASLADECLVCPNLYECGGGYFPHRYSASRDYKNPTIYCADYMRLFASVKGHIGKLTQTLQRQT